MATAPLASILIVEDDGELLEVLQFVLADAGYKVTGASNGADALRLVQSESIDLAVLDVAMAGMSGLEVAIQLRASEKTARVLIALHTGLDEESIRTQFSDYDAFLPKADDADMLVRRVSEVLAKHPRD